jgi:hypothetical protein
MNIGELRAMTDDSDNNDPYRAYKLRLNMAAQGMTKEPERHRLAAQAAASSAEQWQREKLAEAAAHAARNLEEAKRREAAEWREVQRALRGTSWWVPVVGLIGLTLALILLSEGFGYGVCMFRPGNTAECYREAKREAERHYYDERENNYRSD